MAFIKAPQASEEDEFHTVAPRTDYEHMSEQELELAYEDACWEACNGEDSFSKNKALLALKRMDAMPPVLHIVVSTQKTTSRRTRQRGQASRSSAASGDGNSDPDPEPERRQPSLSLYDQAALADLLNISKKSVQNIYSSTPHLLPEAISIPGARGPRWTPQAVQEWLAARPKHTSTPPPVAPKRKVGRPRIAQRSAGGAA